MKKILITFSFLLQLTSNILPNNVLKPQSLMLNNTSKNLTITEEENLNFEKKASKYKKEVLTLGQNCLFLLTDGKDPYINIFQPDRNTYKIIKIGYKNKNNKNNHITKNNQFENMTVLSESTNIFSANIKIQKKYPGDRESKLGEKIASIFFSKDEYRGKILIDEYKQKIPMFWVLNNAEQLRAIAKYISKNISLENKNLNLYSQDKTLLVIKILDDPKFETLNDKDLNFLNSYFNIFSLNDSEIKKFFENAQSSMINRMFDMAHPKYAGESVFESIFRQTEKEFKEFKIKEYLITAGVLIFANDLYNGLKKEAGTIEKIIRDIIGLNRLTKWSKGKHNTIVENIIDKIKHKENMQEEN